MAGILMTDPGFGRGHTLGVTEADQGTSVTGTQKAFTDSDPRTSEASIWTVSFCSVLVRIGSVE